MNTCKLIFRNVCKNIRDYLIYFLTLTLSVSLFYAFNEARNYHRNKKRLLDREKSFSVLSLEELGQLTSVDHYPSEEFIFSSYGCDLHLDNELVANAFAALPKQEQSILILFCVLELGDGEIGDLMGMSRSAVQRHRTKTLNELQKKLKAHLPEGG